jgi:class III poly(R)-hydroxyalkanoic acid synthase PhaE subunit
MPPIENPNPSDQIQESNKQWKTWQEMQAGMFKPWMDFWSKAFGGGMAPQAEAPKGNVPGLQLYQKWLDHMQEMMSRGLPSEGLGPQAFQKVFESSGVIQKLYALLGDLFQTYNKVLQEDGQYSFDSMSGKLDDWSDEYRKLVDEIIAPIFPEQLRWIPEVYSGEFPMMYTGLSMHLFAPWMDLTRRLQDRQMRGELMSPQSARQIYEEWRQALHDSFGRILRAPVMGYYRESVEKLGHAINSYTDFNIMLAEFYASIEGAAMQALETMQQKLADLEVEKGPNALSFRDVYGLWWHTNEQVYEELFRTDEFSRLLGKLVDRGMQFRTDIQAYIEEVTKELPFPNRSEMNHLYKAVYQMKHEIRRMSKELAELRGEQGVKAPAERTKRLKGVS